MTALAKTVLAKNFLAKTFLNAVSADQTDIDMLRTIALFCGVGLLVSVLVAAGLTWLPTEPQSLNVMDWI
jgi:hypothetical protein